MCVALVLFLRIVSVSVLLSLSSSYDDHAPTSSQHDICSSAVPLVVPVHP